MIGALPFAWLTTYLKGCRRLKIPLLVPIQIDQCGGRRSRGAFSSPFAAVRCATGGANWNARQINGLLARSQRGLETGLRPRALFDILAQGRAKLEVLFVPQEPKQERDEEKSD